VLRKILRMSLPGGGEAAPETATMPEAIDLRLAA